VKLEFDESQLHRICSKYGIKTLYIFGSQSSGNTHEASDVDILYEFNDDVNIGIEFVDFADELEELFEKPVDLVSSKWMSDQFAQSITNKELLYAA
jgi:predicted nucleotidyltransferase